MELSAEFVHRRFDILFGIFACVLFSVDRHGDLRHAAQQIVFQIIQLRLQFFFQVVKRLLIIDAVACRAFGSNRHSELCHCSHKVVFERFHFRMELIAQIIHGSRVLGNAVALAYGRRS